MSVLPAAIFCPQCGRTLDEGAFLCPSCELLLESSALLDELEPPREPTLIRFLLAPPEASLTHARPKVPDEVKLAADAPKRPRDVTAPTVLMSFSAASSDVATVIASIDLTAFALSSFEAFALSMMDGTINVEGLRQAIGITKPEMQAVLKALVDKGVIEIREPPRKAQRPKAVKAEEIGLELEPVTADLEPIEPDPPPTPPRSRAPVPQPARTSTPAPASAPVAAGKRVVPLRMSEHMKDFLSSSGGRAPSKKADAPPPAAAMSPLQRAIAFERAGNIDKAIELLERSIARSKDAAPLYNRLGIVLLRERRDFARAEQCLEKARKLAPDNPVYEQNYYRIVAMGAARTGLMMRPSFDDD